MDEGMTTLQIVRLFKAKRVGRGKWRAVCPIHGGRYSGPLSIAEGHSGTLVKCFGGCETRDVLASVGLTLHDLFLDAAWKPSPEMLQQRRDDDRLKLLERRHGLAIMAQAVLPEERRYWAKVEQNIAVEIEALRTRMFPIEAARIRCESETQRIIRDYGFEFLWECIP